MEGRMQFKKEFVAARARWALLTLYQKFEHAVILLLAENSEQRALVRVRSQRLRGVPSPVRDDIHSDDRTRVQALAIGAGGAPAQHRAGSYGDSNCFARDRAETVDPRSLDDGCRAAVRAGCGDLGARKRVLARPRSG